MEEFSGLLLGTLDENLINGSSDFVSHIQVLSVVVISDGSCDFREDIFSIDNDFFSNVVGK